jgi:ABC-type glycerol-3-phosphate transport system substrate-binding protein
MIVSAHTPHKAAALEFLAWWNSQTAQEGLAKGSGYPPSLTTMTNDPAIASNPFVAKFAAQSNNARLYLPDQAKFNQIDSSIFAPAIQKATRGTPAATALGAASKQLNSVLGCSG